MILVTVGTGQFPFDRLMKWIDALFQYGFLSEGQEEVIVQYGNSTILPGHSQTHAILPEAKFRSLIKQARLIIAHCGEGTVNLLESTTAPYILVPRSHRCGECLDDNQIELAIALSQVGVPIAWSPGDLVRFLAEPLRSNPSAVPEVAIGNLCRKLEERFGKPEEFSRSPERASDSAQETAQDPAHGIIQDGVLGSVQDDAHGIQGSVQGVIQNGALGGVQDNHEVLSVG
ncbi:MAG TPA: glycosyltransferase [Chroococcidiopsis sp.]